MKSPIPRLLIKLIAKRFYREHTGLLFSLFILVFINFFYTNVLNQTHLTPDQLLATALKLVLGTVRNPLGTGILFAVFFFYSLKTWQYAARRLQEPDVQFLFYSVNALRKPRQLRAWALVQLVTSLPIVILGAYAVVVGVLFGYWLVPLLIPVYLLALIVGGALYCVRLLNKTVAEPAKSAGANWLNTWPKPLFSLFLYEVILRKRVSLVFTKLVSLASITLIFHVFPDAHADTRFVGLLGLCGALSHAVLIYQSTEFEEFYLRFARNFPYHTWQVFGQQAALFGVLLAPELLWFLAALPPSQAVVGILLMLSVTLLFRAVLYWLGWQMKSYLRLLFGLFLLLLFADLFNLTILLMVGAATAAWVLLHRRQYDD
jgi:hypothetical protein